jgi:hypothetical protein
MHLALMVKNELIVLMRGDLCIKKRVHTITLYHLEPDGTRQKACKKQNIKDTGSANINTEMLSTNHNKP